MILRKRESRSPPPPRAPESHSSPGRFFLHTPRRACKSYKSYKSHKTYKSYESNNYARLGCGHATACPYVFSDPDVFIISTIVIYFGRLFVKWGKIRTFAAGFVISGRTRSLRILRLMSNLYQLNKSYGLNQSR